MPFEDTFRSVALSLARFTGFTANAFIFGLVPLLLLVIRPSFTAVDKTSWDDGRRRLAHRLEEMFQACLVASGVATLIALVLQAALVAGTQGGDVGTSSFEAVVSTPFGRWYLLRFPLLAALAVLLVKRVEQWSLSGAGDDRPSPRPVWWWGWGGLGLALLVTTTLSGHAVVARPEWLSILNDVLHLASGAVWLTGIIVLAVVMPDAWRGKGDEARLHILAPAVTRFSTLAAVSITILAITGTVNSLLHVEGLNDLIDTSYGEALALKIAAFLAILGLGGINHFFVRRRMERAVATGGSSTMPSIFRKTIAIELALGLTVMILTGVLTGLARTKDNEPPATVETGSDSRAEAR